jgi:hypothetical protein
MVTITMSHRRMPLARLSLAMIAATSLPWSAVGLSAALAGSSDEIRTSNHNDPDLHLFVDDEEVERIENLKRELNRPRKHPVPVLVADQPWEGERAQAWGSVIVEPDGLLRMWYFAMNTERRQDELDRGGYAYAESRDGLHWEKPPLGIVEFRGSKENNLFYTCAPDGENLVDEELARRGIGLPAVDEEGETIGVLNNLDGLTVVRDEDDPDPARRYKLIANMQDHRMWAYAYPDRYPDVTDEQLQHARTVIGQYLDTSPDGIHWARTPRRVSHGAGGDYMMVTRDHRNGRWWLNERFAGGQGGRNAGLRTGIDLANWSDPAVIFDNGPESEYGRIWEWHGGITPFNYGNLNLGFLERWPNQGFGATCELISQRDGKEWTRVAPNVPFLDVGPEGAFDRVLIYPTHNAPIRIGDRLFIFYTGGGVKTNPKKGVPMSIGVATIGLDRFAGLANWRSSEGGKVITRPLVVTRGRLEVNVESLELAPVRVAVCTQDGAAIAGYDFADCQVDYQPDRTYSPVRWRDKKDLSELVGQTVQLQFEIKGAVLYSYRFVDELQP